MADLVPIQVVIGLKLDSNSALYPDFDTLPTVAASGMVWSQYVDRMGSGWRYDKTSGHQDDTPDSPRGQQLGLLLVPKAFADEAIAAFPATVTKLTEAQAKTFWETKATIRMPDRRIDAEELTGLNAELALRKARGQSTTALEARIDKALDENDLSPGVRPMPGKLFDDWKTRTGTRVVQ